MKYWILLYLIILWSVSCWSNGTNTNVTIIYSLSYGSGNCVSVNVGGTVTWINGDGFYHSMAGYGNVTSPYANLSLPMPQLINSKVNYTFPLVGVFQYFCAYHPSMFNNSIVVGSSCPNASAISSATTLLSFLNYFQ